MKLRELAKGRSAISQRVPKWTKSTVGTIKTTLEDETADEGHFSSLSSSSDDDFEDGDYHSGCFDDETDNENDDRYGADYTHHGHFNQKQPQFANSLKLDARNSLKVDAGNSSKLDAGNSSILDAGNSSKLLQNKVRIMGVLAKKRMRKVVSEIHSRKNRTRINKTGISDRERQEIGHIESLSEAEERYDDFSLNSTIADEFTVCTPSYIDDIQSTDEASSRHRRSNKMKSMVSILTVIRITSCQSNFH